MGFFESFRKKKKPRTIADQIQAVAGSILVNSFRRIASANNIAPTSKTPDQKIIEIYKHVGSAFKEASKKRNEHIPAGQLNTIVLKFYQVYEMMGDELVNEHLKYEIEKYIKEGLRQDYQQDLKLF